MGILDMIKRALSAGPETAWRPPERPEVWPQETAAAPTSGAFSNAHQPLGRPHIKRVARSLASRHPDGVPYDILTKTAAAEGLDPGTVLAQIEADQSRPRAVIRRRKVKLDELRTMDLSALDSVRMRIKGSAYAVSDAERRRQGGFEYLLIREPDNEADPSAVAVYGMKGVRVGYVSTARAASLSPLLAQLDVDAFKVSGAGATASSIVLWVDVPRVDALRKFVRDVTK